MHHTIMNYECISFLSESVTTRRRKEAAMMDTSAPWYSEVFDFTNIRSFSLKSLS